MTRHFLYLLTCEIRNATRRQVRRLRQPRYVIAAVLGLLYFFFIFGGWMAGEEAADVVGEPWLNAGRTIGPLVLALFASWWWLRGGYRHGLTLTPAETHLLITAPLTRRQLVRYRVLRAQTSVIVSALIGTLLMRGTELPWPLRFLSLWVLLSTLHLHQVTASLVNAAAQEQGRSGLRRQVVPLVLFVVAFVVLVASLLRALADIRARASLSYAAERLAALLVEPGPRVVLAPFRLLLAPTVARSVEAWLPAFGAAVLVLGLHYLWVQRTDAAFEEAAAEEGAKRHERMEAVRSGGFTRLRFTRLDRPKRLPRAWLPLRGRGRPAYAIFWKNVLYMQRSLRFAALIPPLALLLVMLVVVGGAGVEVLRDLAMICLMFGLIATIGGPLAFRNDLRMDLRHVDQLRTYPLAGRDLVAAEIAAAAVSVAAPQLVLVATSLTLFLLAGSLSVGNFALMMVAAVVALPIIDALAVAIQNALALLYPEWSRIGVMHDAGIESVGQGVLTLIATLVLLVICAIPPVLVGLAIGAPLALQFDDVALFAAATAGAGVVVGEVVLIVRWLGSLYDATDPSTVGLLR